MKLHRGIMPRIERAAECGSLLRLGQELVFWFLNEPQMHLGDSVHSHTPQPSSMP